MKLDQIKPHGVAFVGQKRYIGQDGKYFDERTLEEVTPPSPPSTAAAAQADLLAATKALRQAEKVVAEKEAQLRAQIEENAKVAAAAKDSDAPPADDNAAGEPDGQSSPNPDESAPAPDKDPKGGKGGKKKQ
jgi:hypothetical protein